jgi:hypothetical protein
VTLKLIPKDEYFARENEARLQIMGDIEPFLSPVSGELITSRGQLREHNRRHGVTNAADYGPQWFERKAKEREALLTGKSNKQDRIETILKAFAKHGG